MDNGAIDGGGIMKWMIISVVLAVFLALVFSSGYCMPTNYIVVVNSNGTKEYSSYETTNTLDWIRDYEVKKAERSKRGRVVVVITKAEYDADKDVDEKDRLKNIDAKKIADAVKAYNKAYPAEKAGREWDNDSKLQMTWEAMGKTKQDFIQASTNLTAATP